MENLKFDWVEITLYDIYYYYYYYFEYKSRLFKTRLFKRINSTSFYLTEDIIPSTKIAIKWNFLFDVSYKLYNNHTIQLVIMKNEILTNIIFSLKIFIFSKL